MEPALYKYVSSSGLDILINQRIKATPPNRFNDVFEFQPLFEGKPSNRMVKRHLRNNNDLHGQYEMDRKLGRTGESFKEYKKRMRAMHREIVPAIATQVAEKIDIQRHTMIDRLSHLIGVICFTTVPNSLLMWAHYATSHSGLVVEFDTQHPVFSNTPRLEAVKYSHMRPVITLGGNPNLSLDEAGWNTLLTKSIEWAYESEWRTTTPLPETEKVFINDSIEYFAPLPAKAVKSVIFGARASDELKRDVFELVAAPKLRHVSIFEARLHETEYRLLISEVNKHIP